ncbi:hypothetical protein GCM10007421_21650 [Halopseudomonas oceani]|nr:GGDEF domain-containing protein [Halopseudomonas oceani]GGE47085.1 hypothetical protein GCM10007421_21650 [Halopseudomonas oceani]
MLADLDLKTLTVTLTVVTLAITLLLCLVGWQVGPRHGMRYWTLGNLAVMLGLLLNINQGHIPHSLSIVLANGLMTLGLGVVWLGLRNFRDLSQPQWMPMFAALVTMLLLWFFRYQVDNLPVRYAISSLVLGGFCLLCAAELLVPTRAPMRTASWFSGLIALAYGLILVARPAASLAGWNGPADLLGGPLQLITVLGAIAAQIGMVSGFILMIHYRNLDRLRALSEQDPLTGALNRRSLQQQAELMLCRTRLSNEPITLIMLDADHFKRINDEFGHQTGDEVLCHLVDQTRLHLRSRDLLGRFGGEEFVLLLPGLNSLSASQVAERIRQSISDAAWPTHKHTVNITVSLGVACSEHHGYDFTTLLGAADAALYCAKGLGRNRVEQAQAPGDAAQELVALRLLSHFRHNLDV